MTSTPKYLTGLILSALLVACSEHQPIKSAHDTLPVIPQTHSQLKYIPPVNPPGHRTVEEVQGMYGAYAQLKLNKYFSQAKVAFPPSEIKLVALKQEKKLELWARDQNDFRLVHTYPIRAASGVAGPKLRQGDKQVPEGIYRIQWLNPNSNYHLSMKINYPNEFDLSHATQEGRHDPGGDIFIHGRAASIGCLAMGDEAIEELFILTAQVGTENVEVLIAPHDPRARPLKSDATLPFWTAELYETIASEIKSLPAPVKSAQSSGTTSMLR